MEESNVLAASDPRAASLRELRAAREIAQAFLTSRTPEEVYRLALERVAPLVGAVFGCVYLRAEADPDTLRLAAAWNWPAAHARWLGEMRVRVGAGPTGRAVQEGAAVEVWDVFADEALQDWWDAARELGFASSIALPLVQGEGAVGAITFYFRQTEPLREGDASLLRLVADQLSATAQKAHLIHDLQQANALLREQNVELEARFREAEEARRMKNELLANVSHELRTPLTAILGYAYLLREGLSGQPLAEEGLSAVERIESAGTSLMGMIDDLLDLTHLKLDRLALAPEECDAVALARAALSDCGPAPPGVEVRTVAPEGAVPVQTDPSHVLRILRNLLSNALKFTPRGSVVLRVRRVDVSPTGPAVAWEVEDTGIGMDESDLEKIFDEFHQLDGSATRLYAGTGLGLALSRQVARRMGGDVTVRSTRREGSVFTLMLPTRWPG